MTVVMFAGTVAERVVLGKELPHGHTGDLAALKLCYPDLPEDPTPIFNPALREAFTLVQDNRAEIEAVADRLHDADRLSGEEVRATIADVREIRTKN